MVSSQGAGYVGAVIAIVFFGSNYVPAKRFPAGPDGMYFQWVMCTGIFFTGVVTLFMQEERYTFVPTGLLGGGLWASGNLMVIPIINRIGMGLGLLLWSVGNLIIGYCVGKFGLFGVAKTVLSKPALNYIGFGLGLVAMALYFFVKPELEDGADQMTVLSSSVDGDASQHGATSSDNLSNLDQASSRGLVQDAEKAPLLPVHRTEFLEVSKPPFGGQILGVLMALAAGTCYGFSLVPSQIWFENQQKEGRNPGKVDFVFSQTLGIYLVSTVSFCIYCAIKKNNPQLFSESTLPAMACGVMWGIANAAWIYANASLGFVVGYPIVVVGPCVIGSLWSVLLFREIKGQKNLTILSGALVVNMAAVICIALSQS